MEYIKEKKGKGGEERMKRKGKRKKGWENRAKDYRKVETWEAEKE